MTAVVAETAPDCSPGGVIEQRRSVLLVDDDPDVRGSLGEFLSDEGYDVVTAENGAHALSLLNDGLRPTIVVMDLMMPEMDGLTFRRRQLERTDLAAIPVVVVSASGTAYQDACRSLDIRDILAKPVDVERLLAVISDRCSCRPSISAQRQ